MGRKQNQQQESKKFLGQNSTRKTKDKSELSHAGNSNRNGNIGEMGTKGDGNKLPVQPSDAGWAGQRKRLAWP